MPWGWEDRSPVPFGLRREDRRQHLYAVGKTGLGKTTLLRNLIAQDLDAGEGVGVLDPHGDLAETVLDHVPPWRVHHVVYLNPADLDFPAGFNLVGNVPPSQRHLAVSAAVSAFKSVWNESWGPRLEYILANALAALLDAESGTLLGVLRMLSDARYRERITRRVEDPVVRAFWRDEYERYETRFRQEAIAPIQNKVGRLLANAPVRNMLGQVRSTFDPRFVMDEGRILIANLAKGTLGEDKANLLGSLLASRFQLAAMARTTQPEEKRRDFYLYIDEFQNFTTDSFAAILSEARKYRLCLTLCHQYLDQLRPEVRAAVFGNVGSMVVFRVGQRDAELLQQELGSSVAPTELLDLQPHEVAARLLEHGVAGDAFRGFTLPPLAPIHCRRQAIVRSSRERFTRPRQLVEDKIRRWLEASASRKEKAHRNRVRWASR